MSEQTPKELPPLTAVDPTEAARRLGVSKVTLWHWARAGKITAIKVSPRIVRYRVDEIEKLLGGQP